MFKNVTYIPGTLEAVALDKYGKEIGRTELKSAAGDTVIRLSADKDILYANGQDLSFIDLQLSDQNGITKSSVDRSVHVEVSGAGTLQGFGSAVPNTENSFYTGTYSTYQGRALIVVRAGYEAGEAVITVEAEHLESRKLTIQVKERET